MSKQHTATATHTSSHIGNTRNNSQCINSNYHTPPYSPESHACDTYHIVSGCTVGKPTSLNDTASLLLLPLLLLSTVTHRLWFVNVVCLHEYRRTCTDYKGSSIHALNARGVVHTLNTRGVVHTLNTIYFFYMH